MEKTKGSYGLSVPEVETLYYNQGVVDHIPQAISLQQTHTKVRKSPEAQKFTDLKSSVIYFSQ